MYFVVQTVWPGPMAYNLKLFIEEQGILKTLELPFEAVCEADPSKLAETEDEK